MDMDHLLVIGNWLLPLLYLALLIDYGATFFLKTRTVPRRPHLLVVVVLHGAYLVLRSVHLGRPPLVGGQESLSVVAWAMAAVYVVVEWTGRDRRTGVFILFLAFILQYTSSMFLAAAPAAAPAAEAGGLWSGLHTLPALVAYTAFAFAAIYGLLYLVARRDLKSHRFGVFFDRLPPLDLLGRMMWHALLVGFAFMTVTIVTGPLMLSAGALGAQAALSSPKVEMKIVTGGVAWVIYAVAILGRTFGKWPPGRISGIAVVGYLVVMALLVASALMS
jgi:ABC-type uncharacterized transport system permease subunit